MNSEAGKIWALGYATKKGIEIKSNFGDKITVKATAVGKIHAPDPDAFVENFLNLLGEGDVVLTPLGPTQPITVGSASRCGGVFWIHTARLAKLNGGKNGKKTPDVLLKLFEEDRGVFYEYQPTDQGIAQLSLLARDWLSLEREAVAIANKRSQLLRSEREYFRYFSPQKDSWIQRFADFLERRLIGKLKQFGLSLKKGETEDVKKRAFEIAVGLYDSYFSKKPSLAGKERKEIVEQDTELLGVAEELAFKEKEVIFLLKTLPENRIFDGLISEGANRARVQVLTRIRNPLLYQNVRALLSYSGVGNLDEGQAVQRRRGGAEKGHPAFKKALVFDFAEKYWQNDPIGIFENLYYAYKRHQYYMYWELVDLTGEVFKIFGKKPENDEEGETVDDGEDLSVADGDFSKEKIREIAVRLEALLRLPIIERGPAVRREIEALKENPNQKRLWRLFARGKVDGQFGLNLQMTRKRIEAQVKRMLGTILVKTSYYRWLQMLGMPLPLEQDEIYLKQWKAVKKTKKAPTVFDPNVVVEYYNMRAEELFKNLSSLLPLEVEFRLVPPSERLDFLQELSNEERLQIIKALTPKEQDKYSPLLPIEMREELKKTKKGKAEEEEE